MLPNNPHIPQPIGGGPEFTACKIVFFFSQTSPSRQYNKICILIANHTPPSSLISRPKGIWRLLSQILTEVKTSEFHKDWRYCCIMKIISEDLSILQKCYFNWVRLNFYVYVLWGLFLSRFDQRVSWLNIIWEWSSLFRPTCFMVKYHMRVVNKLTSTA